MESTIGDFGVWTGRLNCANNGAFLVEAQFKSEGNVGSGDDTGGNSLNMKCTDGEQLDGEGGEYGDWSSWVSCPSKTAICGIQTKLEPYQGNGGFFVKQFDDDTMLNEVSFYCCSMDTTSTSKGEELSLLSY